jgi:hypothetical protein
VFSLLDMHRHLSASLPALESMLAPSPAMAPLLGQLQALLRATASAAAVLFAEYAESVARDGNKVLPMDGTVHPLTAQVLSYLKVRWAGCRCGLLLLQQHVPDGACLLHIELWVFIA